MDSVSPVWTEEQVGIERVIALDQSQYLPIVVLPVRYSDGTSGLSVRFRLSDEERKAVAEGADVVVTELTFGADFTPIDIRFCVAGKAPYPTER
jgi:hypothetical protein